MDNTGVVNEQTITDEWLTLREAAKITGKSVNALRLLIGRHRLKKVKKAHDNQGVYWMIHRDEIDQVCLDNMGPGHAPVSHNMVGAMIPLSYHDGKQKEWLSERDQLQAGLMMYRYKFEEMERQVKMLPAPAEISAMEQERAAALARAQEILSEAQGKYQQYEASMAQLAEKLQEEEQVARALQEQVKHLQRPWWKKWMGLK